MDKCPRCGLPPESVTECKYCGYGLQDSTDSTGFHKPQRKISGTLFQKVSKKQIGFILLSLALGITFMYQVEKHIYEKKRLNQIAVEREQERLNRIESQKKENERKQAERERRRIDYEKEKKIELQKAMADVAKFKPAMLKFLKSQDLDIVQDIYINKDFPEQIVFKMKPIWHHRNKHLRKNDVLKFWSEWAAFHNPSEPEKTSISVVSINGDKVGGTKLLGGVWVEE